MLTDDCYYIGHVAEAIDLPVEQHEEDTALNAAAEGTWKQAALDSGMEEPTPAQWEKPSFEAFSTGMRETKGAAGLDGWTREETSMLLEWCPDLVAQLLALWVATIQAECEGKLCDEACDLIFGWRIVGIPRRGLRRRDPSP